MMIRSGDVYCPRCGSARVGIDITHEHVFWGCEDCQHQWTMEHDGTDWEWPQGQKPNPGCPWCGTANITGHALPLDVADWTCNRVACRRQWRGRWTRYVNPDGTHRDRWTIRIPTSQVPFAWLGGPDDPPIRWGTAPPVNPSYTG